MARSVDSWLMSPSPRPRVVKPPEQRREELLEAALALFRDRGFDETTVQDVARAAGVASGTVYLYFSSKEEILNELERRYMAAMQQHMFEILTDAAARRKAGEEISYEETSGLMIDAIVAHALEHRDECMVLSKYAPRGETVFAPTRPQRMLEQGMAELFRVSTAKGLIHTSDPDTTARLLSAASCSAIQEAVALGDQENVERVVATLKELFRKALAPTV